jgi:hypothetical protein
VRARSKACWAAAFVGGALLGLPAVASADPPVFGGPSSGSTIVVQATSAAGATVPWPFTVTDTDDPTYSVDCGSFTDPYPYPIGTTQVDCTATSAGGTTMYTFFVQVQSAPVNTAPPLVSGSPQQGQQLTATSGSWTGSPTPSYSYQWQRCDSSGLNCTDIASATTNNYTPLLADVGSTLLVQVTASNTAGTTGPIASTPTSSISPAIGPAGSAPSTPILDTFNRANGAAGGNWGTMRPSGFATMNISGNAAVDSSASLFAWNYWKVAAFGPDVEAYATIASYGAGDTIRVGARVTGAGTTAYSGYYVWVTSTGTWTIIRIDKGASPTTLASGVTQPLASGDRLGIRVVGSLITALHYSAGSGWAAVLSYDTSGDTIRYTAAGNIAFEFRSSTLDDLGGGTLP